MGGSNAAACRPLTHLKKRKTMRVSQITFKTNVPNPGDRFRHEHAEVVVEVNDGEDPQEAFRYAREVAESALGINVDEDDVADAERVLAAARKAGLR